MRLQLAMELADFIKPLVRVRKRAGAREETTSP